MVYRISENIAKGAIRSIEDNPPTGGALVKFTVSGDNYIATANGQEEVTGYFFCGSVTVGSTSYRIYKVPSSNMPSQ